MAVSAIPKMGGDWNSVTIANETYGALVGYYNSILKLGFVRWSGNATAPTAGTHEWTLPSAMVPQIESTTVLRNGDYISVRPDGTARVVTTTSTWSTASLMYLLK